MSQQTDAGTVPAAGDPSMEDILASIRRILNEDGEAAPGAAPTEAPAEPATAAMRGDDVLVLDDSMLVQPMPAAPEPAPQPAPPPPPRQQETSKPDGLLNPDSEAAAAASVGSLLRTLTAERGTEVFRGGPTIEDLVREGIRPLLKNWLDVHLPPLVEKVVRAEIERVTGRAES